MKKYMDLLTNHLKKEAQARTYSGSESELKTIYEKMRKEFLDKFFTKFADKCNAIYQYFAEHDDYVLISIRFKDPTMPNGDYPSKYKLNPFDVEVMDCISKNRAEENLNNVELIWINYLSETIGEEYDNDLQEFEDNKHVKPD